MSQMSLIMLGLFSLNELGVNGAILHSVAHGLVSATLFLLAGMVETRTGGTSDFGVLGGMARGRPMLATILMTIGIIALAVPGSAAFAGEFLILAGVYDEGWWWAAIGAGAIVLAAMYMLRLISAVLHRARGFDVPDDRLDLRAPELAVLVPLVGLLLVLSAWPASIAERSVPGAWKAYAPIAENEP
jgi:NADH-quinone oxidoreductase subunit M